MQSMCGLGSVESRIDGYCCIAGLKGANTKKTFVTI